MNEPRSSYLYSILIPLILLASGIAGLIYEQIWIRWLSLIFGMTAPAIAVTLSAYFFGLALGARFGPRIFRWNPLKAYATWEIFVVSGSLIILIAVKFYKLVYPFLYGHLSSHSSLFHILKLLLSLTLLLPATFSLGATLPVIARSLPEGNYGARIINLWYAANTLGAVIGAALAGYGMPLFIGITGTYSLGIGLSLLSATAAFLISLRIVPQVPALNREESSPRDRLLLAAFLAGVVGIALEILWSRLFAQVLPNSILSFTTILLLFLISYSISPLLVNRWFLASKSMKLWILFWLCMIAIWASPYLFYGFTSHLNQFISTSSIVDYLFQQAKLSFITFFPAIILTGMLLPSIWSISWSSERYSHILFWNLLGGASGALIVGIGTVYIIGLLKGIILCGLVIGIIPMVLFKLPLFKSVCYISGLMLLGGIFGEATDFSILNHTVLQTGTVLDLKESKGGIVAVVEKENDRGMYLDNFYYLGGTAARENEERMGHIPLLLHPDPERVAFLGSATGITSGASMLHTVKNVTIVELIPEVFNMGKQYFSEYCHGLYADSRVRVVLGDARNLLLGEKNQYDVIIADLYVPWHQGTGNMYTTEYFELIKERLSSRGIFCQWLPLYQLSEKEFLRIVATLSNVFPRVTLWHGDFYSNKPTIGLVAQQEKVPLATATLPIKLKKIQEKGSSDRMLQTTENFFMLWIAAAENLNLPVELNHDEWPRIEYKAAFDQMRQQSRFINEDWVEFCYQAQNNSISKIEDYLGSLNNDENKALISGPDFLALNLALQQKNVKKTKELYSLLIKRLPESVYKNTIEHQGFQEDKLSLIQKEISYTRKEMEAKIKSLQEKIKFLNKKSSSP